MMSSMYGHKWVSSYGSEVDPDRVWLAALDSVTPEQIKNGLRRCATEGMEWPPSAPEFRAMCLDADKKYEDDWQHRRIAAADAEAAMKALPDKGAIERAQKVGEVVIGGLKSMFDDA